MRKISIVLFALVFTFSIGLRFWKLGEVPAGPNWDEAAIAYNGWSIWQTRRDEWLQRLPISFRSFGDYKAPFAIYLNGAFTSILGNDLWVIRLPFAIASVLAILGIPILILSLFQLQAFTQSAVKKLPWHGVAGFSAILLGLSPWHFLFSRVGFESGMALAQLIWASALLFLSLHTHIRSSYRLFFRFSSAMLFALMFYTYHSSKVMVPLFLLGLAIILYRTKLITLKAILVFFLSITIFLAPFVYDSVLGEGLARSNVTVFAQDYSATEKIGVILKNTVTHLHPNFLVFGESDSLRHSTEQFGVLLFPTLLLVLVGLFSKKQLPLIWSISLLWVAFGLAPAIIGIEVPHPNRSLLALPGFLMLAILGSIQIYTSLAKLSLKSFYRFQLRNVFVVITILVHLGCFFRFSQYYFSEYDQKVAGLFQDGYIELYDIVWGYLADESGTDPINQVLITSEYGQPYIYALLTKQISPIEYHNGALVQFLFPDSVMLGDLDRENTIVVAGKQQDLIDVSKATKVIYSKDGDPKFWIFDTRSL